MKCIWLDQNLNESRLCIRILFYVIVSLVLVNGENDLYKMIQSFSWHLFHLLIFSYRPCGSLRRIFVLSLKQTSMTTITKNIIDFSFFISVKLFLIEKSNLQKDFSHLSQKSYYNLQIVLTFTKHQICPLLRELTESKDYF